MRPRCPRHQRLGIVDQFARHLVVAGDLDAARPAGVAEGQRPRFLEGLAHRPVDPQIQRALHDEGELHAVEAQCESAEEPRDAYRTEPGQLVGDRRRLQAGDGPAHDGRSAPAW